MSRSLTRVVIGLGASWATLAPRLGAAADASTDGLYERAVSASQAGDYATSVQLFDEVLAKMPADDPLRTLSIYGAARANQRLGTPRAACAAVDRFAQFIGRADAEPDKREKASTSLPALIAQCSQRQAEPVAALAPTDGGDSVQHLSTTSSAEAPDRTWAWAATAGSGAALIGGAVLLVSAQGSVDDGDAAYRRFIESGRTDAQALRDVRRFDDDAESAAIAAYLVLGAGAALGGVATWLWLRDDEGTPVVRFVPTVGGLSFGVTFQ